MDDFVVVRVSKTNAAKDSLEDNGVDESDKKEDNRCERTVVFPAPDSPKNTIAWSSPLLPNRVQALLARSSASAIELPSFPPFAPLVEEV